MTIYEKNISALKEYDKAFYEAFTNLKTKDAVDIIETVESKDGGLIICVEREGKKHYLNSQYSPMKEAKKFVEQYSEVIDYSYIIIFGLGNGIIAKEMRYYLPEHVALHFCEPSIDIFLHSLKTYDLRELFEDENIQITVMGLNDQDFDVKIASLISSQNYKISIMDALPKYKLLFPEKYKKIELKYCQAIERIRVNINTASYFGRTIAENNIYNMKHFLNCNCEMEFEGLLRTDLPAIIVAAGPSLEKNVRYLKKAKGHALIIAVDTALRYLVEQDVWPDLAVTADPKKPVRLFESELVRQIPLAVDSSANHEILKLMGDKKIIFISSDDAYYNSVFQLVEKNMYSLSAGGSVSTVAFVLAIAWGFKRVVLVGQDLALAKDKVHAGKDDVDLFKLEKEKIEIDGYNGDKVYTSADYKFYLDWYETVITANSELEVINATEGGAKIHNTIQMTLSEVIEKYCKDEFDYEGAIRECPPTFLEKDYPMLIEYWKNSIETLHKLESLLRDGVRSVKKGIDLIKSGNYKPREIRFLHKKINDITEQCKVMDEIYFVDRMVAEGQEDVLGDIYEMDPDNDKEYCRMLKKLYGYFSAMLPAVGEVCYMFEKLVEESEEIICKN